MKYYANDGHICDSLAEKIIDDHLYSKNIKHDRSVPYYPKCRFRADFQIEDKLIEYFGLLNQLSEYDKNVSIKIELAKKLNIKLISLYPKDLEDISMLDKKISNC
jgi:NurA-like 5'-3' nuclease